MPQLIQQFASSISFTSSAGSSSFPASSSLSTQTTTSSVTSASPSPTTPTCYFKGFDDGNGNLGYYADPTIGTFGGCNAQCDLNPSCISYGLDVNAAVCVLYNHTIIGYDTYATTSNTTFFLRGGGCPPAPTPVASRTTSARPLPSPIFPVVSRYPLLSRFLRGPGSPPSRVQRPPPLHMKPSCYAEDSS